MDISQKDVSIFIQMECVKLPQLSPVVRDNHHGRDRMVVGVLTTYVISAYHQ